MAQAIMLRDHGGPEVLRLEAVAVGRPGPGELRLRQTAIGVNFHDCYVRSGLYRTLPLPGVPGIEAVGVVEETGIGVTGFAPGDRVAYVTGGYGAYASERLLPARLALKLPAGMPDLLAATVLLKGLTAEMLLRQVHRVEPGQTLLVHAAAGGVGRLLCQWAVQLGATVIGTAGSAAKAELARAAGCHHVIQYREEDFVARVMAITDRRGVDVAYDSVGKETFDGSLECLAWRGHLVNFGQASGAIPPFQIARLAARSNSLSRPIVFHYIAERPALEAMSAALFAMLASGAVRAEAGQPLPLRDAAHAHHLLETRQAEAPLVLLPQDTDA
ncbi:quinone oxidoreductase [Siccirubricoccus deserti]|uniref:Quinone oxidoreductase n=1 Tax=Siccirubricoccus deserti TaxID=2013562 RepID=A0A9X0QWQ2_9PROT|nr:quinone oxidoreductase [Siccirubricoccus deserti]MBC4015374.1 quinone oxidoreductase [Siccirubricoccus deserti]GGC41115.1 quinone oxidoreductase [Siccirubricoccus deserti]